MPSAPDLPELEPSKLDPTRVESPGPPIDPRLDEPSDPPEVPVVVPLPSCWSPPSREKRALESSACPGLLPVGATDRPPSEPPPEVGDPSPD
jgi:hypothetical protein